MKPSLFFIRAQWIYMSLCWSCRPWVQQNSNLKFSALFLDRDLGVLQGYQLDDEDKDEDDKDEVKDNKDQNDDINPIKASNPI